MSKWYRVDISANEYEHIAVKNILKKYESRTKIRFYWTNKENNKSGSGAGRGITFQSTPDGLYKYMVCIKFKDETDAMAFKLEWT